MSSEMIHWERAMNEQEIAFRALRHILQAAEEAIAARGRFRIALAGGRTPEQTYRLLGKTDADWHRWHIYFGDERCKPVADPQRNSRMASRAWLSRVAIPAANIHPIPAELGPRQAALRYTSVVRQALPFDLVLLGLGNDGHTASLFTHQPNFGARLVRPVWQAPKPPAKRVTLSAAALSESRSLLLLVSGPQKRQALAAWKRGEALPISTLQPSGRWTVIYDREADPSA